MINNYTSLLLQYIIPIVTVTILALYTWETYKLRKINFKLLENEKDKLKPNVLAYFNQGNDMHIICFVLENIGGGAAYNVRIKMDPKIDLSSDILTTQFYQNIIFDKGISILQPNGKYSTVIGGTVDTFQQITKGEIPSEYTVIAYYEDYENNVYVNSFKLNIKHLYYRAEDTPVLAKQNEILENIEKKLEDINKSILSINTKHYN